MSDEKSKSRESGEHENVLATVAALGSITGTLSKLAQAMATRDDQIAKTATSMLRKMTVALWVVAAIGGLMLILVGGSGFLLWRQQDQQRQLGALALKLEAIDAQVRQVGLTTESTKDSVEEAAETLAAETKVDIEVRPTKTSAEAVVVIRPRQAKSARPEPPAPSVVIPIQSAPAP